MFANQKPDKCLICKMHKELLQCNAKKINNPNKNRQKNTHLSKQKQKTKNKWPLNPGKHCG